MSEHISKSELFCNKKNTVNSSTRPKYIYFRDVVSIKKICGYEADRCHAYLKKLFTYMYWFKLFHCYCESNTGCCSGLCWVHGRCK